MVQLSKNGLRHVIEICFRKYQHFMKLGAVFLSLLQYVLKLRHLRLHDVVVNPFSKTLVIFLYFDIAVSFTCKRL